jgi:hypothetical protein
LIAPGIVTPLGIFKPGETKNISVVLNRAERGSRQASDLTIKQSFSSSSPGYYYYYGSDTTVTDIIGSTSYYDNPVMYRRYSLLSSALTNQGSGLSGRGGGFYVAGWGPDSPVDIQIQGKSLNRFETVGETLHIVTLDPGYTLEGREMYLSPSLFTWTVLESTEYSEISPYLAYINGGRYTLDFILAQPIKYSRVNSLILHLESASIANPSNVGFSMYDFTTDSYENINVPAWGDIELPDPEKYVGPGGEVIIRVDGSQIMGGAQLDRTDFTLVVEP